MYETWPRGKLWETEIDQERQNSLINIIMDCDERRNILCLNRCKTACVISELPWGLGVSLPRMCHPGMQVIGVWEVGAGERNCSGREPYHSPWHLWMKRGRLRGSKQKSLPVPQGSWMALQESVYQIFALSRLPVNCLSPLLGPKRHINLILPVFRIFMLCEFSVPRIKIGCSLLMYCLLFALFDQPEVKGSGESLPSPDLVLNLMPLLPGKRVQCFSAGSQ